MNLFEAPGILLSKIFSKLVFIYYMCVCVYLWAQTHYDESPFFPSIKWVSGIKLRASGLAARAFMSLSHAEAQEYLLYLRQFPISDSLSLFPETMYHPHACCNYSSHIDNQRTTLIGLDLEKNRLLLLCAWCLSLKTKQNISWGIN